MRLRSLALFLLALTPSIFYAAKYIHMPEFGRFHDDGLLFVSAKSLAAGEGFRISSLPEQPAQTKYPVLYPLFLSVIWKLNPNFPDNLWIARVASWLLLAACLALCWFYYRSEGFSENRTLIMVALLGMNPYMIVFGTGTFSEIFFTVWLLACFLLARRDTAQAAFLAGVAAGCAYLSRTAGFAFLVAIPAWYMYRRQTRHIAPFIAGLLPFVLGWMIWSRQNIFHTTDETLIYYTDYVKMEFLTIGWDNFYLVLWKNIDGLLSGVGGLAIPQVFGTLPMKMLTQAVGVAIIVGIVRLYRKGIAVQYAFLALAYSAMLVVWHFPPNERFVVPLFPLMLAGLLSELEHLASMLRSGFSHPQPSQRRAAYGMAAVVAGIVLFALGVQALMSFHLMYQIEDTYQAKLDQMRPAYEWIRDNVPASARVLSNDDPVLYLYSGRRGHVVPLVPRSWYIDDHSSTVQAYRDIAAYCRSHGFEYFYSNLDDTSRWTDDPQEMAAVHRAVHDNPDLQPLYSSNFGTVYRVRDVNTQAASR